jgi:hypothetical protein
MDSRKQIYYTKAQVKEGLITAGKEWMFTDGTEYIGQYHTYTTGEVFSLARYIVDKSKKLIPYVEPTEEDSNTINKAVNFEYDAIKRISVTNSKTPIPRIITPTQSDYNRGYITRYFVKKINETLILEINLDDFNEVGSDGGLDVNIWKPFSLKWKISGPISDALDTNGNIVEYGVVDTNKRTLDVYERNYKGITQYFNNNLTQFYQN